MTNQQGTLERRSRYGHDKDQFSFLPFNFFCQSHKGLSSSSESKIYLAVVVMLLFFTICMDKQTEAGARNPKVLPVSMNR